MRNTVIILIGIMGAAACCTAAADSTGKPANDMIWVEVNGAKITAGELEAKHGAELFQARTSYYEAERRVILEAVDQYILQQQAEKEGVTVDALLERHVNAVIAKDPSEEALRVYYEGVDTAEPFEAVRGKIVDALRQRRLAKAKTTYLQSLRSQAQIVMRLPPPRAEVSMKDVPVRGPASARVTVLEFADYQCPVCQQVQPTFAKLEAEFEGKIDFAYKDFPLNIHPDAPKAAEASHCAGAQGKYWEYHDLMLATKQTDVKALKNYADELKLDKTTFGSCLDKGQMAGVVKQHNDEAQNLGLPGTPAVLVNGRFLSGNVTYEKLRGIILEELSVTEQAAGPSNSTTNQSAGSSSRINH